MKLSAKRIQIGNAINVELYEMTERALKLLGHVDSSNIDAFEDHFMKNEAIKEGNFGRRIVREHIVQYILEEFGGVEAFGIKSSVEKHESKNPKGSSGRGKN
ncbi:hypothetical protein AVV44_gp203 [Cronobacter phage S13]|jgi:hypothetical protein|uniref:Uncharacterized protein n=1 Tax=Cronobacter phage LPCS28 TaxID=2924885 RepID=A0AAE9G5B2_9CAUD|nr:hypothetical protein AVV44_gp203 [Cronobacter phage S13]YP_010665818.1 hypothetical protein PQB73_gp206 [Cronobacter phage LPCS28]AIA65035.1 hypothetical protein S13_238 [Cronobacter phage S13]UNY47007.1 hypothetical protein EHEKIMEA_00125 [Cronobacter phage LPCS28]